MSPVSGGTALTDTNGVAISDSVTTSTPDGVFHAYVNPHGTWYGPGRADWWYRRQHERPEHS